MGGGSRTIMVLVYVESEKVLISKKCEHEKNKQG